MGKSWRRFHEYFCEMEDEDSFPSNFIMNGTILPNYDVEEDRKDDRYYVELTSPFLYTVAKTKMIADFLDSLNTIKLRQGFVALVLDEDEDEDTLNFEDKDELDDGFFEMYQTFQKIQRFFHIVASRKQCVIGRKS